ncbi:hypothetical protein FSP39_021686 [Pinctada imbricata]|uniref:Uncharacterized protein n=1 Tax=Pinctada imbricata TaxID=66713 RepID=A0AA88XTW0_PINIB|nr:hypothetical protein FSP39_021686 [Pinctada imbricata]
MSRDSRLRGSWSNYGQHSSRSPARNVQSGLPSRHFTQLTCHTRQLSLEDFFLTPQFLSRMEERHHSIAGLKRVDIRFNASGSRRLGHFLKVVRKKVDPQTESKSTELRAVDSASDGFDFPDDAIDKVAKANCVKMDAAQILPEVHASPCAFHHKRDRRSDLLFLNNHNGASGPASPSFRNKSSVSSKDKFRNPVSRIEINPPHRERKEPPPLINTLPRGMPSKEFVMTWLMHGSEPSSKNHFPEITENDKKLSQQKRSRKEPLRKSTISE